MPDRQNISRIALVIDDEMSGTSLWYTFECEHPVLVKGKSKEYQGLQTSSSKMEEDFDERKDPFNRSYYWMTGQFINMDKGEDTDQWALDHNYISVVPTQFDLTDHQRIALINQWNLNES